MNSFILAPKIFTDGLKSGIAPILCLSVVAVILVVTVVVNIINNKKDK